MKRKGLVNILIFCFLFWSIGECLNFVLVDDSKSYTRIMMHELYEEEDIDILFLGSSHCYRSFNSKLIDHELGVNTFNAGSSSQGMDGSFALLKEADKKRRIGKVYLEMYYNIAFLEENRNRTEMTPTYILGDYMKPSINKLTFLIQASSSTCYMNSILPARRYWDNLLKPSVMCKTAHIKLSDNYKMYDYSLCDSETEKYVGKGYVRTSQKVVDNMYPDREYLTDIQISGISRDWLSALQSIIKYCKNHNIELVLVSAPISPYLIHRVNNYDEYYGFVSKIANDNEIPYYDFNLYKNDVFRDNCEMFMDQDHLSAEGADAFSQMIVEIEESES